MHVISRTDCTYSQHITQQARTVCLTHTDVLLLLVLALAFASWCCFRVVAGTATWSVFFFFALQAMYAMLVCPTLSIALRLAPSTFLADYLRSTGPSLMLKSIIAAISTETVIVFRYLF
jgi:hypothetical protein